MRKFVFFIITISFFFFSYRHAHAVFQADLTFAGNVHSQHGMAVKYGAAARTHLTLFRSARILQYGFFLNSFYGGDLPFSQHLLGLGMRTATDRVYLELGAGVGYSLIFGPDVGGVLSLGFRIWNKIYITIPFALRFIRGIDYAPHLGVRFGG